MRRISGEPDRASFNGGELVPIRAPFPALPARAPADLLARSPAVPRSPRATHPAPRLPVEPRDRMAADAQLFGRPRPRNPLQSSRNVDARVALVARDRAVVRREVVELLDAAAPRHHRFLRVDHAPLATLRGASGHARRRALLV